MKHLCIYITLLIALLYWNVLFFVQINDRTFVASYIHDVCFFLSISPDTPEFSVLRETVMNPFTYQIHEYTIKNCNVSTSGTYTLVKRPVIGDHIHLGMSLSVNDHLFNFHDRYSLQPIPYEMDKYPVTCADKRYYSYEKVWLHNGAHTHCDGNIVHVHPWSAPDGYRSCLLYTSPSPRD